MSVKCVRDRGGKSLGRMRFARMPEANALRISLQKVRKGKKR